MVLAFSYTYDIYIGETRRGNALQTDSCQFTWQADSQNFLILNACENSIKELRPGKILLDPKSIDSVTLFSNELNQAQLLTQKQIQTFSDDWNKSQTRGYCNKPFDFAFHFFPAFQYKLTVFSKGLKRPFYRYNYLIPDSTNWEFEMSKTRDLSYFHN